MKEQLILALCFGFTAFLFYRERSQRLQTSAALWVPLIWFMILASRPLALWFYPGAINTEEDYVAGNPLDRNIYILLIVLGFSILIQRLYRLRGVFRDNQWLLLFIFYCGLSLLWSDYPEVAGKRFLRSMGSLVMVLIIVTEADPFEAIKCILRRTGYVLIPLSLVLIKYFRDLGVMYSLWGGGAISIGVTTNKNPLGRLCLICAFYFLWELIQRWRSGAVRMDKMNSVLMALLFLMSAVLLMKSDSKTALLSLLTGVAVYAVLGVSIISRNAHLAGRLAIGSVVALYVLLFPMNMFETLLNLMGRDATLTDRVYLWEDIIALVENPILGAGFDSFWLGDRLTILWDKWWFQPNEAHNGYLEIFIETGWIGLGICLAMVLQVFRKLQRLLLFDSVKGRFLMSYLIMFLMFNITEASFKFRGAFFFIFLIITLYAVPKKLSGDKHEASCTHQDYSRREAVQEHQNI